MRTILSCIALSLVAALFPAPAHAADARPVEARVDKALAKRDTQRFWVTPEFLMMWSKDGKVNDVGVASATGLWTDPTTPFVFKENDQEYGMQLGGRLTFGMWADEDRKWGFELSGFALEEAEDEFNYLGSSITFPFYETSTGSEVAVTISTPATLMPLRISSESQLWGVEGQGLHNLKRGENLSLDLVFGIKHLNLSEDFQIHMDLDGALPGSDLKDSFETENQFFGAKAGIKFHYTAWDRLLIDVQPAVSLGADCEELKVSGHTLLPPTAGPGFIYTGLPNIGTHNKTAFAVVPEIKVGLGCRITKNVSFNANYNFLYVSNVLRPGEQVTRRINVTQILGGIPGPAVPPADPRARMESSDYWAHGVGVNLKIKF